MKTVLSYEQQLQLEDIFNTIVFSDMRSGKSSPVDQALRFAIDDYLDKAGEGAPDFDKKIDELFGRENGLD